MLQITIPAIELWDERTQRFVESKEQKLQLEHSLVSLSKWESKWCKAFLGKAEKTDEEVRDYIRCMTITQNVDPNIYNYLTRDNFKKVNDYIQLPMTATTFNEKIQGRGRNQIVTAEVIYSWMFALQIPIDCQKWHLNKLLTQIRTCNIMNQPSKKMNKKDVISQNAALNAARRQRLNSKG